MALSPEMILKWQEMADLTFQKCKEMAAETGPRKFCNLGACCSSEYCDMAVELMVAAGATCLLIKTDPASFHPTSAPSVPSTSAVSMASVVTPKDPKWTEAYFKLREELENSEEHL